jgi:hypothetical protein
MTVPGDIDRERILRLKQREDAAFVAARPRSAGLWERAKVSMPNGVPMSWLRTSYDHPPLFVAEGKAARFRDADGTRFRTSTSRTSMLPGYCRAGRGCRLPTRRGNAVPERRRVVGRRGTRRRYRLPSGNSP